MPILEYQVSFNTPAFLGNAEQQAQWRTPPFKTLLRQWWRLVKVNELLRNGVAAGVLHGELLRLENKRFGTAADDNSGGSQRSLIRLRLDSWEQGKLEKWENDQKILHPEVDAPNGVGAELYLGFGPLTYGETGKTNAKGFPIKDTVLAPVKGSSLVLKRTAIDVQRRVNLRIMFPAEFKEEIHQSMQLAAWFGNIGSRSRNGWGSLYIEGDAIESLDSAKLLAYIRPLADCLKLDWPHAIGGTKAKPAVWTTKLNGSWREIIRELSRIKIELRTKTQILTLDDKSDGELAGRHILAYPVTNHAVRGPVNKKENIAGWVELDSHTGKPKTDKRGKFIQSARLANQIRFKVAKQPDGKMIGLLTHLPCKLPDTLLQRLSAQDQQFVRKYELAIWQDVHKKLDELCNPL